MLELKLLKDWTKRSFWGIWVKQEFLHNNENELFSDSCSITTVSRLQGKTLQISILTRSFSIDRFLLAKYHNHYHMYVNHMLERSNKLCGKKMWHNRSSSTKTVLPCENMIKWGSYCADKLPGRINLLQKKHLN